MIIRHAKTALPRVWKTHSAGGDILAETDILVRGYGTMRAKLLVFPSATKLVKFWDKALGRKLGRKCAGCVSAMATEDPEGVISVDPRYFCVIGLSKNNLSMEVITHESVHAGFAYSKRHRKDFWVKQGPDFDEEDVAYPAGRIAKRINAFLYDKGLYT